MKRVSLYEPYHRFVNETQWLLIAFQESLTSLNASQFRSHISMLSAEMAVIRLHDAWARFCREITVMAAADNPITANGVQLARAPGIHKRSEVIPKLLSTYRNPRTYEPRWAHANECIDAAQRLNISNLRTVSAALGATNSPAEEVNLVRNFFAHRCKDTALKIHAHSAFASTVRLNIEELAGMVVAPSTMRMELWIITLRTIAEATIQ